MKARTLQTLGAAHLPAKQAYAIAHAIELECAGNHETLATKADVAELRADLISDLVRWVFLLILGQTAVLAAAGYFYVEQLVR